MRNDWTIAALLSSALIVGCNGRSNDNPQNFDQNQAGAPANAPAAAAQTAAPAPSAPTQQPYTRSDGPAAGSSQRRPAPQATTGIRDSNAPPLTNLPSRDNSRAADVAAPVARAPQWREVTAPAGTELALEMTSALSSESAQVETPVSARLRNALIINGDTVIPADATVTGTVTDVERSGRVQGRARLAFAFNQVRMHGTNEDLTTNPVTVEAEATKTADATKVGAGAIGGAILGGILGGKGGAGKGAIAGGAVGGGVVLATRGKEVTIAEGAPVTTTLAQPLTIRIPVQ
jgi:outer membrane lipoprotein SlyB